MEKRIKTEWKTCQTVIALFLLFTNLSCKDSVNKSPDKLDSAINIINKNKTVRDSVVNLKSSGFDEMICQVSEDEDLIYLTFSLFYHKSIKRKPYKIARHFKIRKISDVGVLFLDSNEKPNNIKIDDAMKDEKMAKEWLKKGMITFEGNETIFDGDFVAFVFCKRQPEIFKSYNFKMMVAAENAAYSQDKPFRKDVFYPQCTAVSIR